MVVLLEIGLKRTLLEGQPCLLLRLLGLLVPLRGWTLLVGRLLLALLRWKLVGWLRSGVSLRGL